MHNILIISDTWESSTTLHYLSKELVLRGHHVKIFSKKDCTQKIFNMLLPKNANIGKWCRWAKTIHIATLDQPIGFKVMLYCVLHNIPFTTEINNKVSKNKKHRLLRLLHKKSRKILVPTAAIKRNLEYLGFNRVVISFPGVYQRQFNVHFKQSLNCGRPLLLYVGSVEKDKNLDSFCELKLSDRTTKVIIGTGRYLEELQSCYPNVIFIDSINNLTELAQWYASADCFVCPIDIDAVFDNIIPITESISCGTPVAGYTIQSMKDAIIEEESGCLRDNLQTAVEDVLNLDNNQILKHCNDYSWDKSAELFLSHLSFK